MKTRKGIVQLSEAENKVRELSRMKDQAFLLNSVGVMP